MFCWHSIVATQHFFYVYRNSLRFVLEGEGYLFHTDQVPQAVEAKQIAQQGKMIVSMLLTHTLNTLQTLSVPSSSSRR